jgi:hypothetical protein
METDEWGKVQNKSEKKILESRKWKLASGKC